MRLFLRAGIVLVLVLVGAVALFNRIDEAPSSAPSVSPPGPTGDAVIAAAGDIACSPHDGAFHDGRGSKKYCRQRSTSDLLLAGRYAAILALGDNQYEFGALDDYREGYAPSWGRLGKITYPVPGNHEYGTSRAAGYYAYFAARAHNPAQGYYSFDIGAWHVIALNSNCGAVGGCDGGSPQERWLREDLKAHPNACTLAYWHHPRFSSGLHGDDPSYAAFWRALYSANADLVLVAHDHHYERFAPQDPSARPDLKRGIREFVVGTGGRSHYPILAARPNSEVRSAASYGVLALTLRPQGYSWRFLPITHDGFKDSGSGTCH